MSNTRLDQKPKLWIIENDAIKISDLSEQSAFLNPKIVFAPLKHNAIFAPTSYFFYPHVENSNLVNANKAENYIDFTQSRKKQGFYLLTGNHLCAFDSSTGGLLFDEYLNFPNVFSEQSSSLVYTDVFFHPRWHSLLVGVTEGGVLFAYDLNNRRLLWQLPISYPKIVVALYPFRDVKGDWLMAVVFTSFSNQTEIVFLSLAGGKEIVKIALPDALKIDPPNKVSLVGIDKLGRGFVDYIYLSTKNAVWKVIMNSAHKSDWHIQARPVFKSEADASLSKVSVTNSTNGKGVTITQVMHSQEGDRLVQWLDDPSLCHYPISLSSAHCIDWIFPSKGKLSNPVMRQQFIVISEQMHKNAQLYVISKKNGKIVNADTVQWIYAPTEAILNESYLNFTPQILLSAPRQKMQTILVQRQDGAIGLGRLKIDYEDLGRITWWST